MDYLRNLGSAAVSTLVQKSGLNLPFTLGPRAASLEGIWTLYDGTKRDDGTPVSVFEYDFSDSSRRHTAPYAKNALRKLRTTRHPDVLKFIDVVQTDTTIHIMTERVRPLSSVLPTWKNKTESEREDWLIWGLHRISVALAFVNEPCASTHGNVRMESIFLSPSGEWKLGGFELLGSTKDEEPILYTMGRSFPGSISSPEVLKNGNWSILKDLNPAAADSYALGALLQTVFNPNHPPLATLKPPHPPPPTSSLGAIPKAVYPSFRKLLNPNPKARLTAQKFLEVGMAEIAGEGSGFFAHNRLVKVCLGLDNFNLESEGEKAVFLKTLKESASSFPPEFASYRVLPSIISALEYGGASAATILPLLLQFGQNVSQEEYPTVILAPLIKMFASSDRAIRMTLLDHLPEYVDKLDKKVVTDKLWPHLQTGFSDTVAVMREATLKAIVLLSAKFSDRILNNDLLRHLAKLQSDPEASIRTNTCILIGRLAPTLGQNTKRKVLVPAFSKAVKDPFVHARVAGLMAFMATVECFEVDDVAGRVVPSVAGATLDTERLVRDQAFKAIELFVRKLEAHSATLPDTSAQAEFSLPGALGAAAQPGTGQTTLVSSAAGAAGTLAGWAISSLGKKLAPSDLQSAIGGGGLPGDLGIERPSTAPLPLNGNSNQGTTLAVHSGVGPSRPDVVHSVSLSRGMVDPKERTKGMQLGARKVPTVGFGRDIANEIAAAEEEAAAASRRSGDGVAHDDSMDDNPWGTDDLIDVNADADDWSAFESAPPPMIVEPKPIIAAGSIGQNGSNRQKITSSSNPAGNSFDLPANDPWGSIDTGTIDPWGSISSPAHNTTMPISQSHFQPQPQLAAGAWSTSSSRYATPSQSPGPTDPTSDWDAPEKKAAPVSMTKEERAAEMARRKEERKQRIAQLKEQKKSAGKG